MDTLYSITHNKIKKVRKVKSDRFYYNRFEYCLSLNIYGASCLRGISSKDSLDRAEFENAIKRRFEFRTMYRKQNNFGGNWTNPATHNPANENRLGELISFSRIILDNINDLKIVVSTDSAYIYSNSQSAFKDILALPFIHWSGLTQIIVDRDRDTVRLSNSTHKIRSYFRNCRVSPDEKKALSNWLMSQENIRLSPSLESWIGTGSRESYVYSHFFIDHDDARDLLMMDLIRPQLIRKVKAIVTA